MKRKIIFCFVGGPALLLATWAIWLAVCPQEELPASWSLEEIAKETPPYGAEGRVFLLAWMITEDDRPLRIESCLVLRVLEENEGYQLAHLYRHPCAKDAKWDLSTMHVSGAPGTKYFPGLWIHHCKRFKERPGNKEIYAALSEEVGWSFEQDHGWRFVACAVCEKSWEEAIGERPERFFVHRRNLLDLLHLKKWLGGA